MKAPVRYQRKRTPGWKKPHKDVVNVGRPSMWGNPFHVKKTNVGAKKWSVLFQRDRYSNHVLVESYEHWIDAMQAAVTLFDKWFDDSIADRGSDLWNFRQMYGWKGFTLCSAAKSLLRGKDVMCWCDPGDPCHGDVILRKVNS